MENRQFELAEQAHAYSTFRPTPPQDLVDAILTYLGEEVPRPFMSAVDAGCGTGQSTIVLAPHFQRILGCDISKAQIKEANLKRKQTNVKYKIAPAESLPVSDKSVHLLTAATCFHWLNKDAFFREASRVLAPDGVLAVYSSYVMYPVTDNLEIDSRLKQLTDKVLYEDMKPYRSPCVQEVFEQYKNIYFPFHEITRIRNIRQKLTATAADAVGYIRSMSTFQNFRRSHQKEAEHLLQDYQNRMMEILGTNLKSKTPLTYQRDYFLILCRRSTMEEPTYKVERSNKGFNYFPNESEAKFYATA